MNGKTSNGCKSGKYSRSVLHISLTTLANVVHATGGEERNTSPDAAHTHMFLVVRRVAQLFHVSSDALALAQGLMNQVSMCVVC